MSPSPFTLRILNPKFQYLKNFFFRKRMRLTFSVGWVWLSFSPKPAQVKNGIHGILKETTHKKRHQIFQKTAKTILRTTDSWSTLASCVDRVVKIRWRHAARLHERVVHVECALTPLRLYSHRTKKSKSDYVSWRAENWFVQTIFLGYSRLAAHTKWTPWHCTGAFLLDAMAFLILAIYFFVYTDEAWSS